MGFRRFLKNFGEPTSAIVGGIPGVGGIAKSIVGTISAKEQAKEARRQARKDAANAPPPIAPVEVVAPAQMAPAIPPMFLIAGAAVVLLLVLRR